MEQYRWGIESKGDLNKVRKILVESNLVTLAAFGTKGQSYILSGRESVPSFDQNAYAVEVSRRQIGMLNSNGVRLPYPPSDEIMDKLYNLIGETLDCDPKQVTRNA